MDGGIAFLQLNHDNMKAVSSYNHKLQEFIHLFHELEGRPVSLREVAAWAIREKLWQPPVTSSVDLLAKQLSQAARVDYISDMSGRRVRRFHARRMDVVLPDGEMKQETFWDDITTAQPEHMHMAFQQRRRLIVSDCHQLKTDVASYNDNWNPGNPIQMSWDFTEDVEELDQPTEYPDHFDGESPITDDDLR